MKRVLQAQHENSNLHKFTFCVFIVYSLVYAKFTTHLRNRKLQIYDLLTQKLLLRYNIPKYALLHFCVIMLELVAYFTQAASANLR